MVFAHFGVSFENEKVSTKGFYEINAITLKCLNFYKGSNDLFKFANEIEDEERKFLELELGKEIPRATPPTEPKMLERVQALEDESVLVRESLLELSYTQEKMFAEMSAHVELLQRKVSELLMVTHTNQCAIFKCSPL